MGGGDLNLKKSWHPSTLRNIERVWKAEQKHEVEKQKIEQLQKELAEERAREEIQTYAEDQGVVRKKDERLDWMYQGPAAMVNRDEYLLGRKIDKTFEVLQKSDKGEGTSKDEEVDAEATIFSSQNLSGTATVDLANKIREDPLFSIMKKEKEERKNLLTNPVKMKRLQEMLKASLGSPKSKKSKKSKKKKKKHHESDSDEDKHQKRRKEQHKREVSDSEDDRMLSQKYHRNHYSMHKVSNRESYSSEKRSSYSENNSSEKRHKSSRYQSDDREPNHRYSHHHDSPDSSSHRNSLHESSSKEYRSHQTHHSKPDDTKSYHHKENHRAQTDKQRRLDVAERESLLKQMQENAKWRDDQRKRNTQRYREEDEREEKAHRSSNADFIKSAFSKNAGKGSLEDRVKQKIFSIQRSSADMDKHFARRD